MVDKYSAKPTIQGFQYQFKVALLLILRSEEGANISIETNDDIELNYEKKYELVQVKHHSSKGRLLDSSVDFWKSIRIWSDFINSKNSATNYYLFTTDLAQKDSICYYLKSQERNEALALAKMEEFISNSNNISLTPSFRSFSKLSAVEKRRLLKKIIILDNQVCISDIDVELKKEIRLSTRPKYLDLVYDRFLSWWYHLIEINLIEKKSQSIYKLDVEGKLADIVEQFRLDSLPIDFIDMKTDKKMEESAEERSFVKQLDSIKIDIKMVRQAILDYYKAFAQRSKWSRENLLMEDELEKYEKKLIECWELIVAKIKDLNDIGDMGEEDLKKIGRQIFYEVIKQEIHIRERVTESYVMRGSYHMLADETPSRVWWHPYFKEKIEQILKVN